MSEDTDPIDKAFADAIETMEQTTGYECRNCGRIFDSGRDARQHMFSEHDNPKGVKRHTKND